MREITRSPLNGQRVVSLFSGCGGSSLGYRMAGFKVVWANEFIPAARETYLANFPDTVVDGRDIRTVTGAEILTATGLAAGELDILDGSPPCASFSMAGKRQHHWGKVKKYSETTQRTDDLFFEYIRLLRELRPRRFIAENVSGLVKGVGKGFFLEIFAGLKAAGYRVESRLLDAQWLGVPQARQRIFFVGVRNDVDGAPGFPTPLPYRYAVADALPWLASCEWHSGGMEGSRVYNVAREPLQTLRAGGGGAQKDFRVTTIEGANGYDGHAPQSVRKPAATVQASRSLSVMTKGGPRSLGKPAPTVQTHGNAHTRSELTLAAPATIRHGNKAPFDQKGKTIRADRPLPTVMGGDTLGLAPWQFEIETEAQADGYAVGRELDKLAAGEQSDRYFSLKRAPINGPSPTVTAAGGDNHTASVAHPTERRKFSIAELRRICGFPDDFVLTGTYAQQWERLGRAVPPPMMAALAKSNQDRSS
jgi:DNA (cytosine-5)-methyltransferase 1